MLDAHKFKQTVTNEMRLGVKARFIWMTPEEVDGFIAGSFTVAEYDKLMLCRPAES